MVAVTFYLGSVTLTPWFCLKKQDLGRENVERVGLSIMAKGLRWGRNDMVRDPHSCRGACGRLVWSWTMAAAEGVERKLSSRMGNETSKVCTLLGCQSWCRVGFGLCVMESPKNACLITQ